jgi:hypothetical protein
MREGIAQPGQQLKRHGEFLQRLQHNCFRNLQKTSLVWHSPNTLPIIRSNGWLYLSISFRQAKHADVSFKVVVRRVGEMKAYISILYCYLG